MINETVLEKPNDTPDNTLDLILFKTQTIAQQHTQELKRQQSQALEYLNLEIKTVEAKLDAMTLQNPPTQAQLKYSNKLQNKLIQLRTELKVVNEQIYNQNYLAELEKDLLNPHKPSKEFQKPAQRTQNPLSEMYLDKKNPPTLSKDQEKVHNHVYTFYNKLFSHQRCKDDFLDLVEFMGDIETKKITEAENNKLEEPFTISEVATFIKTMSNEKASVMNEASYDSS